MRNYSNLANIFLLLFNILKRSPVVCILTIIVPLISGILTFFTFSAQSNLINTIVDSARLNMNEMIRLASAPIVLFVAIFAIQSLLNKADMVGITGFFVSIVHIVSGLVSVIWLAATNGYIFVTVVVTLLIVSNVIVRVRTEMKVRKVDKEVTFEGRMAEYLSNSLKDAPILRELKVYSAFDFFKGIWSDFVLKHYKRRYGVRKYEIKVGMILAIIQTTAIYVILLYLLDKMNESDQVTVGGISVLFLALLPIGGQIMALSLVQFVYRRI